MNKPNLKFRLLGFKVPPVPNNSEHPASIEALNLTRKRLEAQGFEINSEFEYLKKLPGVHVLRLPHLIVALNEWEYSILNTTLTSQQGGAEQSTKNQEPQ